MALKTLNITNFRNLTAATLTPTTGCNLIYGDNGSGKTSLLEAIHTVGLGKSFREHHAQPLIRLGSDRFIVFSEWQLKNAALHTTLGIERLTTGQTHWRMNAADVTSIASVATLLPLRVINAHTHHLIEQGPLFRRKFLDWGLFYHFDAFIACFRKFEKILKHRNALLWASKTRQLAEDSPAALASWTAALVEQALLVTQLREQYVQLIRPIIIELASEWIRFTSLHLSYDRGWKGDDYATVLLESCKRDGQLGYTQYGPHCADLMIIIDGMPAKQILSRGQQKLLVCALLLAQGVLLKQTHHQSVIYLIDDLPSELDVTNRKKLLTHLLAQNTQIFITAIDQALMDEISSINHAASHAVFSVESLQQA